MHFEGLACPAALIPSESRAQAEREPSARMFRPALWSRLNDSPQCGHSCRRCDSSLGIFSPQAEQICDVPCGFTAIVIRPGAFSLVAQLEQRDCPRGGGV